MDGHSKLDRAQELIQEQGLVALLWSTLQYSKRVAINAYLYQVRTRFETTDETVEYNGVRVRPYRSIDRFVPICLSLNQGGHREPDYYEFGLCRSLRRNVFKGDTVVVVGGGLGVTATVAAEAAGASGTVTVFEGARNMVEHIEETVALNEPAADVTIVNGIVASMRQLEGSGAGVSMIPPSALPACDVLELDCEGAETEILSSLDNRPRTIIVETHGNEDTVRDVLTDLEYTIQSREPAEVGQYESMCEEQGVFVLTAVQ